MSVWVVLFDIPYEGDVLEAIFATEAAAEAKVKEYEKTKGSGYGHWRVEEWMVRE